MNVGHHDGHFRTRPRALSADEVRATMPRVGDRLIRTPTLIATGGFSINYTLVKPQPCTVVYTNPAHLWYLVQYEHSGFREGFTWPQGGS